MGWLILTESKKGIEPDFIEFSYKPYVDEFKQELKKKIDFSPPIKEESGLIDKKRALKRWKQSFGYYSMNHKKFIFGLRDL